jgi:hypothetical protein
MKKLASILTISLFTIFLMACSASSLESDVDILRENGWENFLISSDPGITIIETEGAEEILEFVTRFVFVAKGEDFFSLEVASIFEFETTGHARDYYNEQLADLDEDQYVYIRGKVVYNYLGSDHESFQRILKLRN